MYVLHIETILDIDLFKRIDELCLHAYSHHRESSTRAVTPCLSGGDGTISIREGDFGLVSCCLFREGVAGGLLALSSVWNCLSHKGCAKKVFSHSWNTSPL
jgi:hypothetical protein